jgi:DNA recombination protein RmuC
MSITEPLLLVAVGLIAVVATAVVLLVAMRGRTLRERSNQLRDEVARLNAALVEAQDVAELQEAEERRLASANAALAAESAELRRQLDSTTSELRELRPLLTEAERRNAELATRLQENARAHAEREASFRAASENLRNEFQLLGHRIFEEHGRGFADESERRLDALLLPFREQLGEFKRRVDEIYHTESKDRASLLTEVRNLQRSSDRINVEAQNLARALKGDKRVQGNWGELVLERVLDASGLRRGHEYDVQVVLETEEGDSRKRPDVIVHLPEGKDVIIDAKTSLAAYDQALAADDDGARAQLVRQHVLDLRAHVKRLADQDYDRLKGVQSLDFVLLFVPVESAFTLAMEHDTGLFTDAFARRIVIVSPTTLMMTLRIIHNVWRVEKQNRNAEEIARRAGALYDKLRNTVDDMVKLGATLRAAGDTYETAMRKLATGRGNLVRQVEQFRELGASVKRPFPAELLEEDAPADDYVATTGADEDVVDRQSDESDASAPLVYPREARRIE